MQVWRCVAEVVEAEEKRLEQGLFDELVTIKKKALQRLINRTAFAASNTRTKVVRTTEGNSLQLYNDIRLELEKTKITAVATDGIRLALAEEYASVPQSLQGQGFQVKADKLKLVPKIVESQKLKLAFTNQFTNQFMIAASNDDLIALRLSEKDFPPYKERLPQEFVREEEISKDKLGAWLKKNSSKGVNYNSKYLLQATKIIRDKKIIIKISPANTLLVEANNFKYYLMPIIQPKGD